MNFTDPSMSLLAASGGDTVKLFDVSKDPGDPCVLTHNPSPGYQVNSVKWNHTNLVVASAGDDKKISLWRKSGLSMGTIPAVGTDSGDNIEESIFTINFSTKASRYICSGGSGQVVRIWDLQRRKCIKWLKGHTDTITDVKYNCKDEHLASISLSGDLIIHNLASGARATELKDPNGQVLRVLDYSRTSRHLLVTAGDDGSVHLWDTTGRNPKVSWLKQHSAPTAGISFSPSNEKMIASVGLDKKLYAFDSGSRRPSFCIPYEAPFSSVAFREDGNTLAAGTTTGQVVFYDVRAKQHPLTVLRAYANSEAVTSLSWQRSKPIHVNEKSCTPDTALMGGTVDDSVVMPDPLPSATTSITSIAGSRNFGRVGPSPESATSATTSANDSYAEETPMRNSLRNSGLSRLHAPRAFNYKDDMDVFSPIQDVQPITPSFDKFLEKTSLLFPSSRRFPVAMDVGSDPQSSFDWKPPSSTLQDDNRTPVSQPASSHLSSKTDEPSSVTPPENWGAERASDKIFRSRQQGTLPSRFATLSSSLSLPSGSMMTGLQDPSLPSSQAAISFRVRDNSSNQESPLSYPEVPFGSTSLSLGMKSMIESPGLTSTHPRKFSSYAERISTNPSFSDVTSNAVGSPKTKKTVAETREQILNTFSPRHEMSAITESGISPTMNSVDTQPQRTPLQPNSQQGSSFSLQLFQGTLDEALGSFQKSIHEDVRNLHIEVLRQFHLQEIEMSNAISSILDTQAELIQEIKSLRKENQELRQLLVKEALAIQPNFTIFKSTNSEPILPTIPTLACPTVYSSTHLSLSSDLVCTSSTPSLHFRNSPTLNVIGNPSLTQKMAQHVINNMGQDEKVCHPSCEAFMEVIKATKETNLSEDKEPLVTKLKRIDKVKKKKDGASCLVTRRKKVITIHVAWIMRSLRNNLNLDRVRVS
nr:protein NEDD1 [Tanacetum cinerariifolium]